MTQPGASDPADKRDAVARAAELVSREDAEARDAIKRRVPFRRRAEIAVIVLGIANIFAWLVFPPAGLDASDQRAPAVIERDLRISIAGTAGDVDAWRADHAGRLPASLDEAGLDAIGMEYARLDSATFEVRGSDGDLTLTYDSRTPLPDFVAAAAERRP